MRKLPYLIFIFIFASACDEEQLEHKLTVIDGEGSGIYRLGETIDIAAAPAPDGQSFFQWTGDTLHVQLTKAANSTVIMPLKDIILQATYKDLPTYQLTVNGGNGSGSYLEGAQIPIAAELPGENFSFIKWIGDTTYINRTDSIIAVITMPAQSIELTATFEEAIAGPSFTSDIYPIIEASCTGNGCHLEYNTRDKAFNNISRNLEIFWEVIETDYMPTTGSLSDTEKNAIKAWIDSGANDN